MIQQLLLDLVNNYIDEQANNRIKAGAKEVMARVFSTILGRHIFEDAAAQFGNLETNAKRGDQQQMVEQIEAWVLHHPLDGVIATFFDPMLLQIFEGMFERDLSAILLADQRSEQFRRQLQSSQELAIDLLGRFDESVNMTEELITLDRRRFLACYEEGEAVAIAKSDQLRRAALQALEDLKQVHRHLPDARKALEYIKRMKKEGIPFGDRRSNPKDRGFKKS